METWGACYKVRLRYPPVEVGLEVAVIALIRLVLRFVWLTLFVLGVRRAAEIIQSGADQMIDRIEEGEAGPLERTLARLHEALHERRAHRENTGDDPLGEM